jgi:MscS family membrane protein
MSAPRRSAARALLALACLVAFLLGLAAPAAAQPPAPGTSPRAAVQRFLELTRSGDDAAAAMFLDLDPTTAARGAELAHRLKAVLDRHAWIDLAKLSAEATGASDDGLAPDLEAVAKIPSPGGVEEPVLIRKGSDGTWRFAPATVARIDAWYRGLGGRWFMEHLPAWAQRPGPYDLLIWQWLALPLLVLVAWMVGSVLGRVTRAIAARLVKRTSVQWDDHLLDRLAGPLRWLWTVLLLRATIPLLGLYAPAERATAGVLRAALFLVFFWSLSRFIDVGAQAVMRSTWAAQLPASRGLVPLGARVAKAVVVVIATISLLSTLGYPVASLIAGLGIGGIALALAAQKTVENLFGAFSIGVDQPFREGDTITIDGVVGTVEAVGLRSTRLRTVDRTVITMPNGKVADARIESFAERDRIRFAHTVGLVYETSNAQMKEILAGFEKALRDHPHIHPEGVVVRFKGFGPHSLDIEVQCWFETRDYDAFRIYREEALLAFMIVVERAGSAFAFPTTTVHMVGPRAARRADPPLPDRSSGGRVGEEELASRAADEDGGATRADGDDPEAEGRPVPERAP